MRRKTRILFTVIFLFVIAQYCMAATPDFVHSRYIIHTTGDSAVNEAARKGTEEHAGLVLKELPTRSGVVVLIPEFARGPIAGIPGVLAVEPDVILVTVKGPATIQAKRPPKQPPSQPSEVLPWGVNQIDAELAWSSVTGLGAGIAIIDTGIDKDHKDLMANIAGGQNFVGTGPPRRRKVDPTAWNDDNGHGTHVAGIAAAIDNTIGVIGVAPGAKLWAVKVLDKTGSGYLSDVISGIYWATDNPNVHVINLSLGIEKEILDQYPYDKQLLQNAVDYAYDQGVVVVAAAGNEGPGEDTVIYPARFDSVIAVSATDSANNLASFSSTGPSVELAAPGVNIYSTWNDGLYYTISGTSMASPHVAATAALILANNILDDLDSDGVETNVDVRMLLQQTADDLGLAGVDNLYGYGLVDAEQAATGNQTP